MNIYDESFEQPIFGANYFHFMCKPVNKTQINDDSDIKLVFNSGGCNNFLPRFAKLMEIVHSTRNKRFKDISANIKNSCNSYSFSQGFAMSDPSDPTVVYVSAPPGVIPAQSYSQQYPQPNYIEPTFNPPQQYQGTVADIPQQQYYQQPQQYQYGPTDDKPIL